ncbi:hypothetical protein ACLB1T_21255 [Escherichia coli]
MANYAATHDIGKLGIERYYEDVLHGQTGYEEVEVNNLLACYPPVKRSTTASRTRYLPDAGSQTPAIY